MGGVVSIASRVDSFINSGSNIMSGLIKRLVAQVDH